VEARRISDPGEFLARATPFLVADEARHNLILGLAGTLRDRPGFYAEHRLWVVEDGGEVVGAALQTPPFALVLAQPRSPGALRALAEQLHDEGAMLPGAVGSPPEVDDFATAWESLCGVSRISRRRQRIYRVTEVRQPHDVPGRPRAATHDDLPLLVEWVVAFGEEATATAALDAEHVVRGRLDDADAGFLLWDHDEPVSLAGWGAPTPNGIRVGPVYTPPEHRSRGYASAVTAALSAEQLAAGRQFCFLYTDLANPTSNRIYMNIGYEPVCDAFDFAFEPAAAP
jgi:predicted GNAT family acetyltransferase